MNQSIRLTTVTPTGGPGVKSETVENLHEDKVENVSDRGHTVERQLPEMANEQGLPVRNT